MELEIIPFNEPTDQNFFIDGVSQTISEALVMVDAPLDEARKGDFDSGFATIRSMASFARMVGWSLAKLIHGMYREWIAQGRDPERFWLRNQDETTLKRLTMERYMDAWDAYLGVPKEYGAAMLAQPIKNAIQLGSAMSQGFQPSEEELEKLTTASTFAEFSDTLRNQRGREPREGALKLCIDMTTGDITAWMNGERRHVGYLQVKDAEDFTIVSKAIQRIMRSAGIIKE